MLRGRVKRNRRPVDYAVQSILVLLAATLLRGVTSSSALAQTAPLPSLSRYMQTVSTSRHYDLGCSLGQRDAALPGEQFSVVILDYGAPYKFSSGAYGATLFSAPNATVSSIKGAVIQFAKGYYVCTGLDVDSTVWIGIGTSNYGSYVTREHGRAWSDMVTETEAYTYPRYGSQAVVVGADDIEIAWNSATTTKNWINGYDDNPSWRSYIYYGDAAGCPPYGNCSSGSYSWGVSNVHYAAWGAPPALPVPQIYTTSGSMAKQWQQLRLWSYNNWYWAGNGPQMVLFGALTQYQACADTGSSCSGTNNTPGQGWTQLFTELATDTRTVQTDLWWSTDMTWQN